MEASTIKTNGSNCDTQKQTKTMPRRRNKWPLIAGIVILLAVAIVQPAHGRLVKRQEPAETEEPPAAVVATEASLEVASSTPEATSSTTPKPKGQQALNFTDIERAFSAVLEEPEVAMRWRQMDKQIQGGMRAALKAIFPQITAMSSDAKVSGQCKGAILKWVLALQKTLSWAVRMLDSIGKPSAGLLEGSLTMFGNYRQCLQVRAPDEDEIELADGEWREYFRGQYCVLQLRPHLPKKPQFYSLNSTYASLRRKPHKYWENTVYDDLAELAMAFHFVNIRADLCVPSLCSRDDIQRVADFLAPKLEMRALVARCEMEPDDGGQSRLDEWQLMWASCLLVVMILVIASTLVSVWLQLSERSHKSKRHSLFTSMSLYKSLGHIKTVHLDRINDQKPLHLYSLRMLIVLWFCLTELTRQLNFQFLRDLLPLRDLIMWWPSQLLVNSTSQFDTLILLTAFTYAYQNINSNLTDLAKYLVAKYSRLMPSIMCLSALTILTPLLAPAFMSPVWLDYVQRPAEVCKSTGPVNLLFLQNLLPYDQICLPHTWLFCVELQLSLLAIPFVYWLNLHFDAQQGRFRLLSLPSLGLLFMALLGGLANFLSIRRQQLPAAWFETFPDPQDRQTYFGHHLTQAWAHLSPFAVGLFAGHLCRCQSIATFSGRPYGRKCCDALMWLTALLLMSALTYSTHSWSLSGSSHLDEPALSAIYGSLGPLLWSLAWALLLFYLTVPDERGSRPALARLLSMDPNAVRLGRLAFLVYLLNPYVTRLVLGAQQQAAFGSLIMLGHTFLGNLAVTFALAFLVSCLVELPCRRLIKKLALGSKRHCSNLGIISRQLDLARASQQPQRPGPFNTKQQVQQQPMIPLK